MKPKIAIYPGTFDPVTLGHVDIINRAIHLCDQLIIGVAAHTNKTMMFNLSKRIEMIEKIIKADNIPHVTVKRIEGLTVDFAVQHQASLLIRGLRTVSDFDYEFQMVGANRLLNPTIETIFLPADLQSNFISSSMVKQIHHANGELCQFVHPVILDMLGAKN